MVLKRAALSLKQAPRLISVRLRRGPTLAVVALMGVALCAAGCGEDAADPPAPQVDDDLDAGADDASDGPASDAGEQPDGAAPEDEEVAEDPVEPPEELGGERPAQVILPMGYNEEQSWPLLILLHGFGVSGSIQDIYLGLSPKAAPAGFIVLLPDGTPNAMGDRFWNATQACCDYEGNGPDDVAYLSGLIEEATEKLSVDPNRVVLLGHSNGGFMAYRMACDRGDLISSIVVLAGAALGEADPCEPSSVVSVMHVHGTADETIFFEGLKEGNAQDYPSAIESAQIWAGFNGCSDMPEVDPQLLDFTINVPGEETQVQRWTGCREGAEVALFTLEGGPHIPAFTGAFVDTSLEFFAAHEKVAP